MKKTVYFLIAVVFVFMALSSYGKKDTQTTPKATPTPAGGGQGKIAFYSNRDGNNEIYVMNATDGSGQKRLTNNKADDYLGSRYCWK